MKFEKSIKRLEEILKIIESSDVDLEKMLKLFDEANTVALDCQSELKKAKAKIQTVLDKNGEIELDEFK
tara:strand:- start:2 stop:208 length:207 start_codon:yes stop_codon:yes gene_type:complete